MPRRTVGLTDTSTLGLIKAVAINNDGGLHYILTWTILEGHKPTLASEYHPTAK
jgi:hypothetical protein